MAISALHPWEEARPSPLKGACKKAFCAFFFLHSIFTPNTQRNTLAYTAKHTRDLFHERDPQRQQYTARKPVRIYIHRCHHKGKTPRGIAQGARPDASQGARRAALKKHHAHPCYTGPSVPLPKTRQSTNLTSKYNPRKQTTDNPSPPLQDSNKKTNFRHAEFSTQVIHKKRRRQP